MKLIDKLEFLNDNGYLTYKELLEEIIEKTDGCNEVSMVVLDVFKDLIAQGEITNSKELWSDK